MIKTETDTDKLGGRLGLFFGVTWREDEVGHQAFRRRPPLRIPPHRQQLSEAPPRNCAFAGER